jgi:hypothetical protein
LFLFGVYLFNLTVENATESKLSYVTVFHLNGSMCLQKILATISFQNYGNIFRLNGSLFLQNFLSTTKKKIVILEIEKIEDDLHNSLFIEKFFSFISCKNFPKSAFSIKVILFMFLYKLLLTLASRPYYKIRNEPRYFVRKRLRVRYHKKKMRIHDLIKFLALLQETKEENAFIGNGNQLFSLKSIEINNMNWLSNLRFHSICFHSIKKSHFKNNGTYLCILLLLGGDIELNPGPAQLNVISDGVRSTETEITFLPYQYDI